MTDKEKKAADLQYKKMTETPVKRLVFSLSIPTVISMLITMIYNMADTYFVSKISVSASGATGIVFGLMSIFQAFGFLYGQGAGSIISRLLGKKDVENARRFCSTAFFSSLFIGVAASVLCMFFLERLMLALGSTQTILPYAKAYGIYILIAGPALTTSCVMNNILRYEGAARLAMLGLTTGGLLNIALDPLLIFVFDMGISGAGLATCISQYISMIILLFMFLKKKCQCRIKLRYFSFSPKTAWEIVATGFPSFIRNGLNSISTMVLNMMSAPYGDECIAAMSISNRWAMVIFSVCVGIGQGFQPVSAFNFGAGKYDRVRKSMNFLWAYGTAVVTVLAGLSFAFAPQIVSLFRSDEQVVQIGTSVLRYMCIALVVLPTALTANMTFQSVGKKGRALLLASCQNGLFFIPLVIILPRMFGLVGLELAQPVAYASAAIVSIPFLLAFRSRLKRAGNK